MEILVENSIQLDTLKGLTSTPKYLLSKYFYDEQGSKIFCDIMRMPEYYLTDCEYEIFTSQKKKITRVLGSLNEPFDLVELGAGDGFKTKVLIEYLSNMNCEFSYTPVDISLKALNDLHQDVRVSFPDLSIKPIHNTYFQSLKILKNEESKAKIILFLGSSIGNMTFSETVTFLTELGSVMNRKDKLIIGFDLKKDPAVILKAYNDPHGFTRDFNLNLLERINRELGGHFNVDRFNHFAVYEPVSGIAKSYLISNAEHDVYIEYLHQNINFHQWEPIFMEMSQKYDQSMIKKLSVMSGFELIHDFYDHRDYFVTSVWKPIL